MLKVAKLKILNLKFLRKHFISGIITKGTKDVGLWGIPRSHPDRSWDVQDTCQDDFKPFQNFLSTAERGWPQKSKNKLTAALFLRTNEKKNTVYSSLKSNIQQIFEENFPIGSDSGRFKNHTPAWTENCKSLVACGSREQFITMNWRKNIYNWCEPCILLWNPCWTNYGKEKSLLNQIDFC